MPGGGIEPPRAEARRILSPLRLPVPPSRHSFGRHSQYRTDELLRQDVSEQLPGVEIILGGASRPFFLSHVCSPKEASIRGAPGPRLGVLKQAPGPKQQLAFPKPATFELTRMTTRPAGSGPRQPFASNSGFLYKDSRHQTIQHLTAGRGRRSVAGAAVRVSRFAGHPRCEVASGAFALRPDCGTASIWESGSG